MEKWTPELLFEHFSTLRETDRELAAERNLRYDQRFDAQEVAQNKYEAETREKNKELNDVRLRFVSRETFENYREEQNKKVRNAMIFMFAEALAIIALGLTLIGLLLRDAKI